MTQAPKAAERFGGVNREQWRSLLPILSAPVIDEAGLERVVGGLPGPAAQQVRQGLAVINAVERTGTVPAAAAESLLSARTIFRFILTAGRIETATKYMALLSDKWRPEQFGGVGTVLASAPMVPDKARFADRPWDDFQVVDTGSESTLVAFCGFRHAFGVELNSIHPWFAASGANIIYVRDMNLAFYLQGVKSIGGLDQTIEHLRATLTRLGTKRVVFVGNSGGTFGALYYATRLPVNEVISFGGPTSIELGLSGTDDRPIYVRMDEMRQRGEVEFPDLRTLYRDGATKVRLMYGGEHTFDRSQAKVMEGLPNVVLDPVPRWDGHFIIGKLIRQNKMRQIMAALATG